MTPADQAGHRTDGGGAPARRRTSSGIWLTAVRPDPAPDDRAPRASSPEPGLPTDPVDAAVRRKTSGQGGVQGVVRALAVSTLYLPADTAGRLAGCAGGLMGYTAVFSDPRQAPSSSPPLVPVTARWLLAALPAATTLWINPEGDAPYCLFLDDLRTVVGGPAGAVRGPWHPDGTDSALRSAYGRVPRLTTSGEPHHGHAHDGPADTAGTGAASRPLPLPGP
jgi:hypothetical protein